MIIYYYLLLQFFIIIYYLIILLFEYVFIICEYEINVKNVMLICLNISHNVIV